MKVVMKSYMTGEKFEYSPGDVVEFDDEEAERLVSVGGARHLTDDEKAIHDKPKPKAAKS